MADGSKWQRWSVRRRTVSADGPVVAVLALMAILAGLASASMTAGVVAPAGATGTPTPTLAPTITADSIPLPSSTGHDLRHDCGGSVKLSDGVALWIFCDTVNGRNGVFMAHSWASLATPSAPTTMIEQNPSGGAFVRPCTTASVDYDWNPNPLNLPPPSDAFRARCPDGLDAAPLVCPATGNPGAVVEWPRSAAATSTDLVYVFWDMVNVCSAPDSDTLLGNGISTFQYVPGMAAQLAPTLTTSRVPGAVTLMPSVVLPDNKPIFEAGATFQASDGYLYAYGTKATPNPMPPEYLVPGGDPDPNRASEPYLGRVQVVGAGTTPNDVADQSKWRYWNGARWTAWNDAKKTQATVADCPGAAGSGPGGPGVGVICQPYVNAGDRFLQPGLGAVIWVSSLQLYVWTAGGFNIAMRFAPTLQGPWTTLQSVPEPAVCTKTNVTPVQTESVLLGAGPRRAVRGRSPRHHVRQPAAGAGRVLHAGGDPPAAVTLTGTV